MQYKTDLRIIIIIIISEKTKFLKGELILNSIAEGTYLFIIGCVR